MNAALTRLTDGARKKTAKYLTKAQAEAVVIKFASLCNTATILRRVMNAVDHMTFLKRWYFLEKIAFHFSKRVRFSGSLSTLPTSTLQVSFQAMNEHETKIRPYMVCGSWLHPFQIFNQFAPC